MRLIIRLFCIIREKSVPFSLDITAFSLRVDRFQEQPNDFFTGATSVLSTLKLRVVSVVGNQSSLLQRELFCRSDLRIATFTRKISVDTPLVRQ